MMKAKEWMTRIAGWSFDNALSSIIIVLSLSGFLALGLINLKMDSSNEGLFRKDDPILKNYTEFQRQFGRNDIVVAALSSSQVSSSEFMKGLRRFHADLENNVPWLDDVTSLVNVDWMASTEGGGLKVGKLGDEWPNKGNLSDDSWSDITSSSLYKDTLVSSDGEMVLVVIRALAFERHHAEDRASSETDFFLAQEVDSTVDNSINKNVLPVEQLKGLDSVQLSEFSNTIELVAAKHRQKGMDIRLAGGPLLDKLHQESMHHDVVVLLLAALLIILMALFFLFRTKTAVFLPALVILLALASVLGLMGWLNVPITQVSQALPALLLMAGVLDSVHLLGLFYVDRRKGIDRRQAIVNAVDYSGMAVLFTSLTTAAGFLAFTVARMKPIADFGWLSALGTVIVLIYTLLLLPAFIRLAPESKEKSVEIPFLNFLTGLMVSLSRVGVHHSYKVLMVVVLVCGLALPGVMKNRFSYDVLSWFPEDTQIRIDTLAIDKKIKATVPLEIVVDTKRKNGILTPYFLHRLREFQNYAESIDTEIVSIGRASSIVDVIERIHSQLQGQFQDAGVDTAVPDNENLIHQEMLLYESGGARDIARLVDRSYSKARITIRLAWADGIDMVPLREIVAKKANELFADVATVKVTGTVDLVATGATDLVKSMVGSYLFAGLSISLMLIVLWRSLTLGFLAMIPNFVVIYLSVAIMGYFDMTINIITVLLGGIALGLAVDDTVHIVNGIRKNLENNQFDFSRAVNDTVTKIGPMLLVTSMVLSGGFFMFSSSAMSALSSFGLLLSLTTLSALIFDILVVPAVMNVFIMGRNNGGNVISEMEGNSDASENGGIVNAIK